MNKFLALQYFVDTINLGSFSGAAKKNDVPASSISRRISNLESSLGAQLLTRTTRSLSPTEIGKHYYKKAQSILIQVEQSEEMVLNYQKEPSGILKVSAVAEFGNNILLPVLDKFIKRYPKVKLDITLSDQLSKLNRDDIDIAIRGGFAPNERVIAIKLQNNDFIAVASPDYIKQHGMPTSPLDLSSHQGLFYKTPLGLTPWLTQINNEIIDVSGHASWIVNNAKWLIDKAIQGEGVLMLPKWELNSYLQQGTLIHICFDEPVNVSIGYDLGIFLLYQKSKYTIPKIKAAVDFITQNIPKDTP
jgi:DNA-binding transcriptional LysR family regulator